MERSKIGTMTSSLPLSTLGEIQSDNEIWEETDGGAHFKVTRHKLPVTENIEILALRVSGDIDERLRVISEFAMIFGEPTNNEIIYETGHVDIVLWATQL